jgi:hypothetical protein
MPYQNIEARVDRLEDVLTTFIRHSDEAISEIRQDIAEMRQWRVEAQKHWGEIAQRMGSFVEDIVGPNIPQFAGLPLQPIFASLNLPEHIVKDCTRHRIYALGLGPETMQLLNLAELASSPPGD